MKLPPALYSLTRWSALLAATALSFAALGCSDESSPSGTGDGPTWAVSQEDLPGALLSIWGTSASDVWVVGGDARDGSGPLALHYDGSKWNRVVTGETQGDLWWVFGFPGGPIFMGGAGGVILRYEDGGFTRMTTPGVDTVFGIWGSSPTDMWAVGGSFGSSGFAWRLTGGDTWEAESSLPAEVASSASIWKVFGRSANDVWLVGSNGVSFYWDGTALSQKQTGVGSSLFTVHGNADRFVAVGGQVSGIIVEDAGSGWQSVTDTAEYGVVGVMLGAGDSGYAVGQYGTVYARSAAGWALEETGLAIQQDLHGVWLDPDGGVWVAGGQTASFPLTDGVLVHKGDPIAAGGI